MFEINKEWWWNVLNNNLYNMEYYNNPCCGYSGLIIRIGDNRLGN